MLARPLARPLAQPLSRSLVSGQAEGDVPANAITLDDDTPLTLGDGTTYITTDS